MRPRWPIATIHIVHVKNSNDKNFKLLIEPCCQPRVYQRYETCAATRKNGHANANQIAEVVVLPKLGASFFAQE